MRNEVLNYGFYCIIAILEKTIFGPFDNKGLNDTVIEIIALNETNSVDNTCNKMIQPELSDFDIKGDCPKS